MQRTIVIGTRGSALSLKQADEVLEELRRLYPERDFKVQVIKSLGDRDKVSPISRFGSKGVFVAELESHLRQGKIDIAVHSLKDMPSEDPVAFRIAAIPPRLDPRDVLISARGTSFYDLSPGSRLGTGSPRRKAQLKAARNDIEVLDIRGNIDTRMRKMEEGQYEGVVLAAAGLVRMDWEGRITEYLPTHLCLPAVGQGALAVEVRADDEETQRLVGPIDHPPTRRAVEAERSTLSSMGGGCLAPITAYACYEDAGLVLRGMVADQATYQIIRAEVKSNGESSKELGLVLAEKLNSLGAASMIASVER